MSREWKPGDVATSKGFVIFRAENGDGEDRWYDRHGVLGRDGTWPLPQQIRPLVVIDPEDREAVERLSLLNLGHRNSIEADKLQAALREFANPTPPIIEPTGLGAVVEDSQGERWVRVAGAAQSWRSEHASALADFALIGALRVLSEGVTA